jgi:DNA invertase Pin-like site-specific DNA recombinase
MSHLTASTASVKARHTPERIIEVALREYRKNRAHFHEHGTCWVSDEEAVREVFAELNRAERSGLTRLLNAIDPDGKRFRDPVRRLGDFASRCHNGSPVTFPERVHTVATPIQALPEFSEPMPISGGSPEAIAGWIDVAGNLRCIACAVAESHRNRPVYDNAKPHCDEYCDICCKPLVPGMPPISGGSPEAILDPFATVMDIPTVQDDHEADEWILEDAYEAIIVGSSRRVRLAMIEDAIRLIVLHILETEVRIGTAARAAWNHRMSRDRREDFIEWVESCGIRIDPFGDAPTDPAEMFEWMCVEARDGCLIEFPDPTDPNGSDDDDSDAPASTVLHAVPSGVLPGHAGEDHGTPVARDDRAGAGDVPAPRVPLGRGPVSRLQAPQAAAGVVDAPETLTIQGRAYGLTRVDGGFLLEKPDGTLYEVAGGPDGATCSCPDARYRRNGLDSLGCRHVRALREAGLMPTPNPEGDDDVQALLGLTAEREGVFGVLPSGSHPERAGELAGSPSLPPGVGRSFGATGSPGGVLGRAPNPAGERGEGRPRAYWTLDPSRPGPVRIMINPGPPAPDFSEGAVPRLSGAAMLAAHGIKPISGGSPEATPKRARLVAYRRVSTKMQGESGLGLEGQEHAIEAYARMTGSEVVASYTEVESGKRNDRPELLKALAHARRSKATLVIAKLDRLSRNVAFLANLMESGVEFVACDMPHANRMVVHIMAAVAEGERQAISDRTKAALAAYKARGGVLGRNNLTPEGGERGRAEAVKVIRQRARAELSDIIPLALQLRANGYTQAEIADRLNQDGQVTRSGGAWGQVQVSRLLKRETQTA